MISFCEYDISSSTVSVPNTKILISCNKPQLLPQLSICQTVSSRGKNSGSIWKWHATSHCLSHKTIVTKVVTFYVVVELLVSNIKDQNLCQLIKLQA